MTDFIPISEEEFDKAKGKIIATLNVFVKSDQIACKIKTANHSSVPKRFYNRKFPMLEFKSRTEYEGEKRIIYLLARKKVDNA